MSTNSNEIVCPGAIERYLSCGDTIAAWKSIECIIGAANAAPPCTGSSLRLVIENLTRSPTRARIVGPGTWSILSWDVALIGIGLAVLLPRLIGRRESGLGVLLGQEGA